MQAVAEFVVGNMLFVLMHETAHAAITQMGLPVLGRMEDAADTFAALRLIRIGSDFSHSVLTQAAEGLVHGGPARPRTPATRSRSMMSTSSTSSAPIRSCA